MENPWYLPGNMRIFQQPCEFTGMYQLNAPLDMQASTPKSAELISTKTRYKKHQQRDELKMMCLGKSGHSGFNLLQKTNQQTSGNVKFCSHITCSTELILTCRSTSKSFLPRPSWPAASVQPRPESGVNIAPMHLAIVPHRPPRGLGFLDTVMRLRMGLLPTNRFWLFVKVFFLGILQLFLGNPATSKVRRYELLGFV